MRAVIPMSALSEAAGLLKAWLDLIHRCRWENGISTVPGTQTLKESNRKKPGKSLCIIIVKCLVPTANYWVCLISCVPPRSPSESVPIEQSVKTSNGNPLESNQQARRHLHSVNPSAEGIN